MGFTGGSVAKNPPANAGGMGLILGSGRYPGERNGNSLQYSYLGNPMDRGAWWAIVHGLTTTKQQHSITPHATVSLPIHQLIGFGFHFLLF